MDTVVILAYFNFSAHQDRYIALIQTLAYLDRKVDIILVCYGLDTDRIAPSQNLKIIDIPSASVLWQKERFYNIALSHLQDNHQYIVWADADIIFTNNNWQQQLKEILESARLVQLFDRVEDITIKNGSFVPTGSIRKSVVESCDRDITLCDYFSQSGVSLKIGCNPGFAWGAKIDTIKHLGFADFMILGSGDKTLFASAMGYHSTFFQALSLNQRLSHPFHFWGDKVFHAINGQVSCLKNKIYHLVQGNYKNRRYANRYQVIQDDRFAIGDYLRINEYGAWQWQNEDNEYAIKIRNYFQERGD